MQRTKLPWYILVIFLCTLILGLCIFYYRLFEFHHRNEIVLKEKTPVVSPTKITKKTFILKDEVNEQQTEQKIKFPDTKETVSQQQGEWDIIANGHSPLLLVNKQRRLPDEFQPTQLIVPEVRFPMKEFVEKKQMKAIAALALENLFKQAEKNGHILYAISGYRSFDRQDFLYHHYIETKGLEYAKKISAYPGSSEHQTGYAMDISSERQNFTLTEEFGSTPEGKWVAENAHHFGFIVRYPKNKTEVTGYAYEPWHLRYVGNPYATYLFENDLAFEEVFSH